MRRSFPRVRGVAPAASRPASAPRAAMNHRARRGRRPRRQRRPFRRHVFQPLPPARTYASQVHRRQSVVRNLHWYRPVHTPCRSEWRGPRQLHRAKLHFPPKSNDAEIPYRQMWPLQRRPWAEQWVAIQHRVLHELHPRLPHGSHRMRARSHPIGASTLAHAKTQRARGFRCRRMTGTHLR